MASTTFDRLFGEEPIRPGLSSGLAERTTSILPNGPWENEPVKSSRKSWPQGHRLEMGLSEENVPPDDRIFGSRKKRIEEPRGGQVASGGVSAALSPRNKAWSGSPRAAPVESALEPGDKDLFTPSGKPLRRRFPSADRDSVPLPPWISVGNCSPLSARSASPRSSPRGLSPRGGASPTRDRRVLQWTSGYELDNYRHIKVFPENVQRQTCAALNPARAIAKFDKEEHDRIVGRNGMMKGGCKRRISPNSRGTTSSIAFTPPTPDTASASPSSPARDPLQAVYSTRSHGDGNFPCLTHIPRKRLQAATESPGQGLNSDPPAGMSSPRFAWASGMVPDIKEVPSRCPSPRSPGRAQPKDVVSPRSLIRSSATLGTGLCAEEPQSMLENFLGSRKGRCSGRGSAGSPRNGTSPSPVLTDGEPRELGFGTLSWGKVSTGDAAPAGAYGLDVAARQAAGGHSCGTLNQALISREEKITFKEPLMRHRQKVLEQRAQSPRWR